jgi:topoisomerase-4 subunit A
MADFIDEKSAKAKGKRVTTLEVAAIEDITPEPEPEPEPEEESEEVIENSEESDQTQDSIEVEGVTMTFEKPQDTQLDLF